MSNPEDEKVIREQLATKLGVEFCTEEELQAEFEKAVEEQRVGVEVQAIPHEVSFSEIILRCNEAQEKLSKNNPNRFLLFLCATAIKQLCDRVWELENPGKVM